MFYHNNQIGASCDYAISLNIKQGQVLVNFSVTDSEVGEDAISNTSSTSTAKRIPIVVL